MSDQTDASWEPTADDLAGLALFDDELLLRFDGEGRLEWANATAADLLGIGGADGVATAGLRLSMLAGGRPGEGRAPGDEAPDDGATQTALWAPLADAGRLGRGDGTGPHVGAVRLPGDRTAWWDWSAWRDPEGALFVSAHDVSDDFRTARVQWAGQRTLDTLVEGVAAGIAVRRADGPMVLANSRFRQWFPDASGTAGPLSPADQAVVSTGAATTSDETVVTPDGQRTLLTVRFPLRDGAGRVAHVATVASDITARIEAEDELAARERLLDTLVRVSPDVVALVDRQKRLVEVSDVVFTLIGLPATVSREELALHVHPEDVPLLSAWTDAVLAGGEVDRCRHRLLAEDGRTVHLEASGRPVVDGSGEASGAVLVSRDVSAAVEVEAQLQRAVAAAEDASRSKTAFLSRISQELRTPLDTVLAMAEHLQHQGAGQPPLDQAQRDAVEHIDRAGRHLRALIDEVLDVTRVERRGVDLVLEPVTVGRLVEEAVGLARPLGDNRGVLVAAETRGREDGGEGDDGGPWVWADRQRLLQVLLNLLSNAVKYNRPQGTVRVSVTAAGDRVRVAVADTGVGIAPEHLHRLFEPFDRLGAEHSGVEGTGVGLTLTKHLVDQMGGTVEVASAVGTGTVFVVELAAAAPRPSGGDGSATGSPARTLRILHVEDDPASGELVRQLLDRRGGVELMRATDGATALTLARRHQPDLVLLDLGLPDVGGETVLAQLRADPTTAGIPVVVVSADATDGQVRRLQTAGAAAYLTKPVAVGQLLALVDAAGRGERAGDEGPP